MTSSNPNPESLNLVCQVCKYAEVVGNPKDSELGWLPKA